MALLSPFSKHFWPLTRLFLWRIESDLSFLARPGANITRFLWPLHLSVGRFHLTSCQTFFLLPLPMPSLAAARELLWAPDPGSEAQSPGLWSSQCVYCSMHMQLRRALPPGSLALLEFVRNLSVGSCPHLHLALFDNCCEDFCFFPGPCLPVLCPDLGHNFSLMSVQELVMVPVSSCPSYNLLQQDNGTKTGMPGLQDRLMVATP